MAKADEPLHRDEMRYILYRQAIKYFFTVLGIIALVLPLQVIADAIEPFAGRATLVNANVVVSVSLSASLALNGFQYLKGRQQRAELSRLRRRIEQRGWEGDA